MGLAARQPMVRTSPASGREHRVPEAPKPQVGAGRSPGSSSTLDSGYVTTEYVCCGHDDA
ncbi:hypothetical protein PPTG_22856 [Phytophthora nicotianae INRA-310]|uniref:Uncharacterized protein n=1 Tax=Phytophthora nicotianae (strain INRA-310) TaxID=761204 RepID=W2QAN9_PHYN3|nr:hypothetical protein PPTG_22856 [Phytophthora nicotianae INRA-310]ETN09921.1 hypothetical protein PPTG_22856 [Phytophthora nicotianae INRA-310]